jgi:hypothetical protein
MQKKKTILITFSVHNVFRNLFLFPGGFFEQLKAELPKHKDLQIVFLLREREATKGHDEYERLLKTMSANQVTIVYADAPGRTTLIRKVFRFFYAYLVFTNTTKILVTIGMRPEEPPAASNKLLTPLRWFIARVLGKSELVRQKLVPWLFQKIYQNERPFREIFETYKPDLLFSAHIYGDYDAHVIAEAKRQGVRTSAMPSGWDHVDKYFLPFHVDRLFVPSIQVANHAKQFQSYTDKELVITGYPHFDYFVSEAAKMREEELLNILKLPKGSKFIFYVSGSAYCPDEPDIIEKVLNWIEEGLFGPNMYLVVRPYLGSRSKDKEFDEKKFKRIATHKNVVYFDTKPWTILEDSRIFLNVMRHSAIVMCVYSSVFLEAAIFDRPLVATPFDGYKIRPYTRSIRRFSDFEHFKEVLDVGAIREVKNFDELKTTLLEYLADPNIDHDKREKMREEVCAVLDGSASRRLLSGILDMAEKG